MTLPRVLTLDGDRRYLESLCRVTCRWTLATRSRSLLTAPWLVARDLPGVRAISWSTALGELDAGAHDVVVCHHVRDVIELRRSGLRRPVIVHVDPGREALFGVTADQAESALASDTCVTRYVFDSPEQCHRWGADGDVIAPGLELSDYGPYRGDRPAILTVGSLLVELPLLSGYERLEALTAGMPLVVGGHNPRLGRTALTRRGRLEAYRANRVYLNTAARPFGNAANLGVLEAMASGMPVVTVPDDSSPVVHGETGLVSADAATLRLHLLELLEDHGLASRLGSAARLTIEREFTLERFTAAWHSMIASVLEIAGLDGPAAEVTRISA